MKNLKIIRENRKLLQKEVAKFLNVTRQTYGRYENGTINPDPGTIIKLSNYFDVASDYLLGIIDHPLSNKNLDFMRKLESTSDVKELREDFKITLGGKEVSESELYELSKLLLEMQKK